MGRVDTRLPEGEDTIEKQHSDLEILDTFSCAVNQSLQLEDVLNAGVDQVMQLFEDVSGIEVYIVDLEKGTLFLKAHRGLSPEFIGTGTLQKGEGLAGTIADSRTPLFMGLMTDDERIDTRRVKKEGLSSYGGIPIMHDDHVLAVLALYTRIPRTFSQEERSLLLEIGSRLGLVLQNALRYEQAAVRARRFVTISRAIAVTRQLGTLNEVLQDITKVLVQSLCFDQSWIGLIDNENVLQGKAGFGEGMTAKAISVEYTIDTNSQHPAVCAVLEQKPVVYQFVEDVKDDDYKTRLTERDIQSLGYIPILSGEKALGVIGVFHISDQAFDEEDVKTLVSVAEQAAIAIENARLYEQIKTSEVRYRTLFQATGTSLVIIDEEQQFRLVNHAFETLSGYSQDELVRHMTLPSFLSDAKSSALVEKLRKSPQSWEARFTDRNGMIKQVHLTTTRIPDSTDILVSLIDMTRERELERRLFRTEELAAIGELSAGIAHEIRNPLVVITTSVSLLKDEPEISEEGRQLLDVVKEESDHLAAIVDDFLKFARPKKPAFNKEDLNKLMQDVTRKHKELNAKQVEWVEHYDEQLPEVSLDRHQIQQVIANLLLNSLDAMPNGGVLTIETSKEKKISEDWIRFTIADTGIGISEEEISKIFQPFYSCKEKGTGMGLAICRRIIDEHCGDIFVESKTDKGTQFSVLLPVDRKENMNDG